MGTGGNTLRGEGRNLFFAVQFGLWFFAFMLLESFINSNVADLFGASMVNAAYSMGIFCTATGLLVFGLVHAKAAAWCAKGLPAAAAVCAVATLSIPFVQHAALLAALSCTALLACGFVGGYVHLGIAQQFGEGPLCGRVIGAATGLAVFVQFVVQNLMQRPTLELACIPLEQACIPASLVVLVVLYVRRGGLQPEPSLRVGAKTRSWPSDSADKRRHGIYLVGAAAILTVIFTLNDSIMVALDASGTVQLFSGVRLFYALGLVFAGLLYDLGPRSSFTFATVAVQIMAVLVPYFLHTPKWYTLNMAIFYFYGGFYVLFITAEFVSFSAQMHRRALWASLGRTTRSYVAALSVVPVALLYDSFGVIALAAAAVFLNMALLAVCVADAMLMARYNPPESRGVESRGVESRGSESPGVELDDEDVENYARHLHLTEREAQVLVLLVTTEDKNDKMANDLGISRRTLQRHIANVYNKAGVQSRIGLYQALATHVAQA